MATKFNEIHQNAIDEIRFLMGDDVSCSEILKPILEDYFGEPWEDGAFLMCEPEEEPELSELIYQQLFVEGGMVPFWD